MKVVVIDDDGNEHWAFDVPSGNKDCVLSDRACGKLVNELLKDLGRLPRVARTADEILRQARELTRPEQDAVVEGLRRDMTEAFIPAQCQCGSWSANPFTKRGGRAVICGCCGRLRVVQPEDKP